MCVKHSKVQLLTNLYLLSDKKFINNVNSVNSVNSVKSFNSVNKIYL